MRFPVGPAVGAVGPVDVRHRSAQVQHDVDGGAQCVAYRQQIWRQRGEDRQAGQVALGEPHQLGAEAVPGRAGVLLDQAGQGQRAEQPVHGGHREAGPLGEFGELLVGRAVGEQVKQRERRCARVPSVPRRGLRPRLLSASVTGARYQQESDSVYERLTFT